MQRQGQIRKKKRRQQRPNQIRNPAQHQTLHILQQLPFSPQRRHSQPHGIPREELGPDEIHDDQSRRESGALDDLRQAGVAFFEARKAGGGDEGEEACETEEEAAVDVFAEGELGGLVEVVEAGLVELFCGVHGAEGTGVGFVRGHGGGGDARGMIVKSSMLNELNMLYEYE